MIFINFCNDNKITQFKFSSYIKNSPIISALKKIYLRKGINKYLFKI